MRKAEIRRAHPHPEEREILVSRTQYEALARKESHEANTKDRPRRCRHPPLSSNLSIPLAGTTRDIEIARGFILHSFPLRRITT